MREEIHEVLRDLNISEKEIRVYLSLLMSGSHGATAIAKRSRLNRVTTYHILKSLIEKGLISYAIKSGVKCFHASEPKSIMRMLKERQGRFAKILPNLERIRESVADYPNVEVYEGKEGLKSIMDDWINMREHILGIGSEELDKVLVYYFHNFIKRRKKANIKIRIMFNKSKYSEDMKLLDVKELRETRFINCGKLKTGIYTYGNKAAFLTFDKEQPTGLLIDDKFIVETLRAMLEILWYNTD